MRLLADALRDAERAYWLALLTGHPGYSLRQLSTLSGVSPCTVQRRLLACGYRFKQKPVGGTSTGAWLPSDSDATGSR